MSDCRCAELLAKIGELEGELEDCQRELGASKVARDAAQRQLDTILAVAKSSGCSGRHGVMASVAWWHRWSTKVRKVLIRGAAEIAELRSEVGELRRRIDKAESDTPRKS